MADSFAEVKAWINGERERGVPEEAIRAKLIEAGYRDEQLAVILEKEPALSVIPQKSVSADNRDAWKTEKRVACAAAVFLAVFILFVSVRYLIVLQDASEAMKDRAGRAETLMSGNERLSVAVGNVVGPMSLEIKSKVALASVDADASTRKSREMKLEEGTLRQVILTSLKYEGKGAVKNYMVYESVPKEVAGRANDIEVEAEGAKVVVVNPDPEYLIIYETVVPQQELVISYTLKNRVDDVALSTLKDPQILASAVVQMIEEETAVAEEEVEILFGDDITGTPEKNEEELQEQAAGFLNDSAEALKAEDAEKLTAAKESAEEIRQIVREAISGAEEGLSSGLPSSITPVTLPSQQAQAPQATQPAKQQDSNAGNKTVQNATLPVTQQPASSTTQNATLPKTQQPSPSVTQNATVPAIPQPTVQAPKQPEAQTPEQPIPPAQQNVTKNETKTEAGGTGGSSGQNAAAQNTTAQNATLPAPQTPPAPPAPPAPSCQGTGTDGACSEPCDYSDGGICDCNAECRSEHHF